MNICLVSNLFPPIAQGEVEVYVGELAQALAAEHRVVVVTTEPGAHLQPRREITVDGVIVYRLASFFRDFDLYHPQVAATMSDIIKRERPDLVHVHNWRGLSLAAVLSSVPSSAPHIPVAMTLHDYGLLCKYALMRHPDGHTCAPDLHCRLLGYLNRGPVNRSIGLVVSPSHYGLDQHLRRGFFQQAIQQILPYGLEVPTSAPTMRVKPMFDVLCLGPIGPHRGIETLLGAFGRLRDPSLRLHIAGNGPWLDTCKALARRDDRVHFYGLVRSEMHRSLLENADCIVLPTLWPESYPISIQEAFQFGPVVIASRIGGIPEMIRDGVNGLLVEPGDEAGIAAAIERLRVSPELAAKLRASAADTARLYDVRFHVAHLVDAYQRLLVTDRVGPFDQRAA